MFLVGSKGNIGKKRVKLVVFITRKENIGQYWTYSPGQNIWNKVRISNEIGQG